MLLYILLGRLNNMGYNLFVLLLYAIPYVIYYLVCGIYIMFMIFYELFNYIIDRWWKK